MSVLRSPERASARRRLKSVRRWKIRRSYGRRTRIDHAVTVWRVDSPCATAYYRTADEARDAEVAYALRGELAFSERVVVPANLVRHFLEGPS